MRDVHRGSAAEIIPDLLDELGRLRAAVEQVRALADEWQAELDGGLIRTPDARFCWGIAASEARAALEGVSDE